MLFLERSYTLLFFMDTNSLIFAFFLIFTGAAILATLVLYTRQSLLVAYILLGAIVGPFGLKLITQTTVISETSSVGIMFLLFLLGLNLKPGNLFGMMRRATLVTVVAAICFMLLGTAVCLLFRFSLIDSIIIGTALLFSSTIIGLKLLPTSALKYQRIGELLVSILLFQDIIAILVLLYMDILGTGRSHPGWFYSIRTIIALPCLLLVAYVVEKQILFKLFTRFEHIGEYVFLLAIGWCLGLAELGGMFGVSHEIGAFIAGVSLASRPVSSYISQNLKPLRDFFLIVFFFSMGASVNFHLLPTVIWPVLSLTVIMLLIKPIIYRLLLKSINENKQVAWEIGVRLGQGSEFSLLVGFMAVQAALLSKMGYLCIQAVTVFSFILSAYIVSLRYPSPIAIYKTLRQD